MKMATQKPSKPDVILPNNFGGTKTPYTESQISNGYQEAVPQVVDGGNINYEKDAVFKYLKYLKTTIDALVDMPIGKSLIIDSNNRFDYISPENVSNKTNKINEQSTENQYPNAKAVYEAIKDFDVKFLKQIAYENMRVVECSGSVTVTLQNTDEVIGLNITDAATISFDVSVLTFPKTVYTVQIYVVFPNGAKTIFLSATPSILWLNNTVPDFSSTKPHWLVLRFLPNDSFVLISDAGEV
jgi:hypothetical protein